MEYIAKTTQGLENIAIKEVNGILNVKSKKVFKGRVSFKTDSIDNFIKKTRTSSEVYSLIKKFNFKDKKSLLNEIKKIKFKIKKDFVVRCSRKGIHDFKSIEIEKLAGEIIHKKGFKVNLNSNEIIYLDIEDKTCFLGKLIAKDLCKRQYRFSYHNQSINACLAASLIKLANIKNEVLLDPFCRDSVIPIEASLQNIKNIYASDPEKNNIRNSKINAKLAKAKIKFSVSEIDWLDTKFKKNSVKIVTSIPFESKRKSIEEIKPILKEFFHQIKYISKESIVLTQKPKLAKSIALNEKLKIQEKKIESNNIKYSIFILKK